MTIPWIIIGSTLVFVVSISIVIIWVVGGMVVDVIISIEGGIRIIIQVINSFFEISFICIKVSFK